MEDFVEVDLDENAPARAERRTRAPLVAAGAVLAVSLVALVGAGRDDPEPEPTAAPTVDAAPERLAGETIAPPLDVPWQIRWSVPGRVLDVGDAVLVSTADGTGVRAIAEDGSTAWGPAASASRCAAGGRGVVCLPGPGDGQVRTYSPAGTEAGWDPEYAVTDWWVLDGDVVVVGQDDGVLVVQRWTPPGPRGVSWTYRSSDLVVAPVSYPFSVEHTDTWVRVGGTRSVVVDLGTGQEIADPRDAGPARRVTEPVLGLVDRSASGMAVVSDGDTVVVGGRLRLPAPAQLLVGGVVLAGDGEMTAVEIDSGESLWQATGSGAFSDGERVGLVESGDRTDLVARDLVFGDLLWSVPLPDCATYAGVTSAGVVLDACGEVLLVGPAD